MKTMKNQLVVKVNQLLSLFFIVMVQVVINSEWFIINMPLTTTSTLGYPHCAVPKETNSKFGNCPFFVKIKLDLPRI